MALSVRTLQSAATVGIPKRVDETVAGGVTHVSSTFACAAAAANR